MITVKRPIHVHSGARGRKDISSAAPASETVEQGRVPRVSRLMALAMRFDRLLRDGAVASRSEIARLGHVTQPRVTQIMNLLHLAPDIQEELLFLPRVAGGRDPVHERMLRPIAAVVGWTRQREMWHAVHRKPGREDPAPDSRW